MDKRNYYAMIDTNFAGFIENGWADGYADMPSDHKELINQLRNKVNKDDLVDYCDEYLSGYELGSFMSSNADKIYDEDGNFKEDEYSLTTISHHTIALRMVEAKDLESDAEAEL